MNREEFAAEVVRYLDKAVRRRGIALDIHVDTHLFESGAIDSLAFAQFVDFLEGELGVEIPDGQLSVEYFLTPRMIVDNFAPTGG